MEGSVYGIVLAAGRGKRMGSETPKQYLMLGGYPVLYHSLKAFEDSQADGVILVTGAEEIDYCRARIVEKYGLHKVRAIVAGGAERYESVSCGLAACESCGDCRYVLIHDGARPLVTPEVINANIRCAAEFGACVTAVPSKDTIKLANEENFVEDTPERSRLWIIQTPQSFAYEVVREAYDQRERMQDESVTDDAMVVERYGRIPVKLMTGDYRNIKLTTPEDLPVMEALLGQMRGL